MIEAPTLTMIPDQADEHESAPSRGSCRRINREAIEASGISIVGTWAARVRSIGCSGRVESAVGAFRAVVARIQRAEGIEQIHAPRGLIGLKPFKLLAVQSVAMQLLCVQTPTAAVCRAEVRASLISRLEPRPTGCRSSDMEASRAVTRRLSGGRAAQAQVAQAVSPNTSDLQRRQPNRV